MRRDGRLLRVPLVDVEEAPMLDKRYELPCESFWNLDLATRRTLRNSTAEGTVRDKDELSREKKTHGIFYCH